jgi:hypothetical protein
MLVYLIRHPQPIEAQGLRYGRKDLPKDRSALAPAAAGVRGLGERAAAAALRA